MAATMSAPRYSPAVIETINTEDFETASIRSAAPSYTSDAPSYHSTVPGNAEPVPPYSPPERNTNAPLAPLISISDPGPRGQGLPPVPSGPIRAPEPTLNMFRIPSWSTMSANPTARHYRNVAMRRVNATSHDARLEGIKRIMLDRIEEEERNRVRPLEDPHLVGDTAAAQARRQRLARERGDQILINEDRRWDFFLGELSARRPSRSGRSTAR